MRSHFVRQLIIVTVYGVSIVGAYIYGMHNSKDGAYTDLCLEGGFTPNENFAQGYGKGVLEEEKAALDYCHAQKQDCEWLEARVFGVDENGNNEGDK